MSKKILRQDIIKQFTDIEDEKSQSFYKFLRQVLISSTTLLGILISFYSKSDNDICNHILFSTSVSSCGLGILSVAYLLFSEVRILKDVQRQLLAELDLLKSDQYEIKETYVWKGKDSKCADKVEYIASVSFVIFLFTLILYVIF